MKVLVLTVSDRAFNKIYEDLSGYAIERILHERFPEAILTRSIVPDEKSAIKESLKEGLGNDFIITTGGTGISPRDVTPEATIEFCDLMIPGIAETLRAESYKETPNAMLSRGVAGMKNSTIIINLPGSVRAAEFCVGIIATVMPHILSMMRGEGH